MVSRVYREERVSKKSGKKYQVLVVEFKNGYKYESFLTSEQIFILSDVPLESR